MRSTFSALAGHPGLDLVNTIEWRLDPRRSSDDLLGYDEVVAWCVQFGLVDQMENAQLLRDADLDTATAHTEHRQVVNLREAIYLATRRHQGGEIDSALETIASNYREATSAADLVATGQSLKWSDRHMTLATPRHRIARLENSMLTTAQLNLVDQCQDKACGYLYIDTSPRHNRRWCAAEDCGNRNRARRHYERRRNSKGA